MAEPEPKQADAPDGKKEDDKKEKEPKPAAPMKPWVRVAIVVAVIVVLVIGGIWLYHWWTRGRFLQSTDNAYLQTDEVVVSSQVAGIVEAVYVADNEQVQIGQRLIKIDDRANRARAEQAQALAQQSLATIGQYRAQIREQEANIAQYQAQLQGAQVKWRYSEHEAGRYAPLASSGAETAEKLADLISNRDQAQAVLRESEANVAQATRKIATLMAQIDATAAQVVQAQAQGRQAQVDVDSALITATIAGRVGDRQVRVGQYAMPGTRLLTVVPVQSLYLLANFKETQIGLMRIGQPATITVDALSSEQLSGSVQSFSPGTGAQFALIPANNATGNFTKIVQRVPVRIRIDAGPEAQRVLVPGLSVEVTVDTLRDKGYSERSAKEGKASEKRRQEQQRDNGVRDSEQPSSGAGH